MVNGKMKSGSPLSTYFIICIFWEFRRAPSVPSCGVRDRKKLLKQYHMRLEKKVLLNEKNIELLLGSRGLLLVIPIGNLPSLAPSLTLKREASDV